MTKSSGWSTSNCKCYDAGTTLYSTQAGNTITYSVTTNAPGQTFAVVMEKNPIVASVDQRQRRDVPNRGDHASPAVHRAIVWQRTLGVGTTTVKIVNPGRQGGPGSMLTPRC